MVQYIIRLDDACPEMNKDRWTYIENLLDKYDVKPIVGVIPDNKDPAIQREDYTKDEFWNGVVKRWVDKNWTIAQHGCYHVIHKNDEGRFTEFSGLEYSDQYELIKTGYDILLDKGVVPKCFFAPCHSFDKTTLEVIKDLGVFDFISDGYALSPYYEDGLVYFPTLFDNPRNIIISGIYTLVLHPTQNADSEIEGFEKFLDKNFQKFISADDVYKSINKKRKKNPIDNMVYPAINFGRKIKKLMK